MTQEIESKRCFNVKNRVCSREEEDEDNDDDVLFCGVGGTNVITGMKH
jgi:hypothetical protein